MSEEIIEDIDKVVIANHRDAPLMIYNSDGGLIAQIPPRVSSFGFELPEGAYLVVNT